jgi:hypothetical protein
MSTADPAHCHQAELRERFGSATAIGIPDEI